MAGASRRATYEDLMQVPDTKVAELIDVLKRTDR